MPLAQKLEDIHRLAHRHWMKNCGSLGLSYSEFEYLSAIKEQEVLCENPNFHGQHLHDLVTAMGVNKASASAMMDKLERRKFVRVKPCKRDARAKHFLLTKKGEELLVLGKTAYSELAETIGDVFNLVPPAGEQAAYEQLLAVQKQKTKSKSRKATPKVQPPLTEESGSPISADPAPQLSLFG